VAPDCSQPFSEDYLHNGYDAGQHLYSVVTDPAMTGASFSVPEVMRFLPAAGAQTHDRAIVNIRYRDRNGEAGNIITVAYRFPGKATAAYPSDWRLHGNQQPIDSSIRAGIRRREQMAPTPGTAPFAGAAASRFEAGFVIFVNKDGPGSTGLRAVRVKGPGLPTNGVVLTRPDPAQASQQNWLNIKNKSGNTDPAVATFAGNTGNIFLVQRSQGISGAAAGAVRPNPNEGNSNSTQFANWAHPLDYGAAPGSSGYIDFTQLKAMTSYTFEVFYDGETAPRHVLEKAMVTPMAPATYGAALQWADFTAETKRYLNPADALAASTGSIALAWTNNPYAEPVRSAGVYTNGNAGATVVNQGQVAVPKGVFTATAAAPVVNGATVPFVALTGDGTSHRQFQLRYRTLDGSYKDSMAQFN